MSQSIASEVPMLGPTALSTGALARPSDARGVLAERTLLRIIGALHCLAYRVTGGWAGRTIMGGPVLLLTTIGRQSGRERTWPLCYVPEGDALVVVASAGGAWRQPGWYLNLRAQPRVTVQIGSRIQVRQARTAGSSERARLWERVVRQYPSCADYQRRTARLIPVVVLEPAAPGISLGATADEVRKEQPDGSGAR
jgi:deazaflavin-dependent oxidoreductase (nitroreductase family)